MNQPHPRADSRCSRLGALLLLAATSPAAMAQVSLDAAVNAAFERHPESRLAQARRDLGQALELQSTQTFAGDAEFNLKYQTDAIGGDNGYREWEGGVNLPLWWPGQRSTQGQEAARTLVSADALSQAKRLEVAGVVRERLWALALERSRRDEAQLAYDSAVELERDIARRVEAGELARADLLLAQKEVIARDDDLRQAREAEANLTLYTGLTDSPPAAAEALLEDFRLPDQHPALVLSDADAERARAHRDRVAAERSTSPNLWLGGKSTQASAGAGYDASIGIEISVPLSTRAHTAPALAEAEAALTEALAAQARTRHELEEALAAALAAYDRARQALERSDRVQSLAEESLRLSRRAFELGEIDLVRLLQARNDALAAHQNLVIRRKEVGQATARINQALGVLPR